MKQFFLLTLVLFLFLADTSFLNAQSDSSKNGVNIYYGAKDTTVKNKSVKDTSASDNHPQDGIEQKGFFIESNDGTASLRLYASVRVFGAYDFNGLKGGTSFSITDIPVGGDNKNEESFFMTTNLTRFGLESNFNSPIGNISSKVETDFNSDGNHLRLRHAYGFSGFLLAGQTWTVFSDVKSMPNTVDIDGPPTAVSLRSVQIRAYKELPKGWTFRLSIESPNVNIKVPDTLTLEPVSQVVPDLASSINKKFRFGHIQFSGILRSISVRELSGNLDVITGYGGMLSSSINFLKDYNIMIQALAGKGITSFLNVSQNKNIDVAIDPSSGHYQLLASYGGFLSLTKEFRTVNVSTSLVYGALYVADSGYGPDDTFSIGHYICLNTFWFSKRGFRVGAEYNIGFSKNKVGETGMANRLAFTFYYDL